MSQGSSPKQQLPAVAPVCSEKLELQNRFLNAVREMASIQNEQVKSVIQGDSDFGRFDLLLHMAAEKKRETKYALMSHIEAHGC
jgi:hypothetical protein